ncbi:DUF4870 domain-containing protein [Pontiellaceae bacterium B1224]|nr:DUF4870 domain-containing protein [Pontiellaceae bacterium B1224]
MENEVPEREEEHAGETSAPVTEAAPVSQVVELTNEQRTFALCAYLIPVVTSSGFIAPLIIWLLKKGEDSYIENHAKEALNFQITFMIAVFVAWLSFFVIIGALLFPAVIITYFVISIIASIKAYKGEEYNVPLCIRFIK